MKNFSLLDLAIVTREDSPGDALRKSHQIALHAEAVGYHRFWMAEHHNMAGIASAATAVALCQVAQGTTRIRIGAAGVMLPNHSPLVIAEQYGTLAALFPGRVDLGVGRAPGTDASTAAALRRHATTGVDRFPEDVMELIGYFEPASGPGVRAIPGEGLRVPVWVLGSSLYGAGLAAALGLPYAFAAHFAPDLLDVALRRYRAEFRPSPWLQSPYAAVSINAFVADSDAEAQLLQRSMEQQFAALRRGDPGRLQPPAAIAADLGDEPGMAQIRYMLRETAMGSPDRVHNWLRTFLARTRADELILSSPVYDFEARKRSVALAAGVLNDLTVDDS